MNFELLVKEAMVTCWNKQEYKRIRYMLSIYGLDKLKEELDLGDNALSLIISGEHVNRCTESIRSNDFTLIEPTDTIGNKHRLLCPNPSILKSLFGLNTWTVSNVLTFDVSGDSTQYIKLLDEMESIATQYTVDYNWSKNIALYFHCYPFNSVNTLHLHIVDLNDVNPRFYSKSTINLPLKSIRSVLCR